MKRPKPEIVLKTSNKLFPLGYRCSDDLQSFDALQSPTLFKVDALQSLQTLKPYVLPVSDRLYNLVY